MTDLDSSFVIGLAPGRINRGDEPSHYLLRVNLKGKTSTYEHFWKIGGVRVTFPSPPIDLKPTVSQTFNADKTEWTCEVAIPLAEMKVDAVKDGETWRVLFVRDYAVADQSAIVASSDWKFWDTQGFWNMYRLEQEWAPVRMAGAGAAPKPVNMAAGLATAGPAANEDDFAFTGQYDPILNRFYGTLNATSLSKIHLLKDVEVSIRHGGEKSPLAVLKPKSTAMSVEARVILNARGIAAILEWRSPADGEVSIAMEGTHQYHDDTHPGETLRILHVQAGKTTELMPLTRFAARNTWLPVVVKKVEIKRGDKIQFYETGSDSLLLRGLLTLSAFGIHHSYSPGGEITSTQGGSSGTWFYLYNEQGDTPNPGGEYQEIADSMPTGLYGGTTTWIKPPLGNLDAGAWFRSGPGCVISREVVGEVSLAVDDALPPLTPGIYRAEAVALDKDRRVLGRAWQNFIRYDHEKDLPWIGNKLGVSDKVQPPWTPIRSQSAEVRGQQSVGFSCWGREYQVDGSGLLTGLTVAAQSGVDQEGRDILAGPVRVELVQDGKPVA